MSAENQKDPSLKVLATIAITMVLILASLLFSWCIIPPKTPPSRNVLLSN
ncbi:MAG: hypothetical protein AB7F43_09070 [Bacteriovoracia bacterium]